MIFLLLLPVLAAGYFTSIYHPYVKLSSAREEGQRLYLRAVSLGFASLAIGALIAFFLSVTLPDTLTIDISDLPGGQATRYEVPLALADGLSAVLADSGAFNQSGDTQSAWLLLLSATSFVGAGLIILYGYIRYGLRAKVFVGRKKGAETEDNERKRLKNRVANWFRASKQRIKLDITAELLEQSPMDRLLFRCQRTNEPIQIYTKDRKIYIGMVVDCAEPFTTTGTNNEVMIVPLLSGYRAEDDLQVEITTDYVTNGQEVELILRQDEILSVSKFDWNAFHALKPKKHIKAESS